MDLWEPITDNQKTGKSYLLYGKCTFSNDLISFSDPLIFTGYWDDIDKSWCSTTSTWEGPFFEVTHFIELPELPEVGGE